MQKFTMIQIISCVVGGFPETPPPRRPNTHQSLAIDRGCVFGDGAGIGGGALEEDEAAPEDDDDFHDDDDG